MADLFATGTSEYLTGSIDTAPTLINAPNPGKSPTNANQPNGLAAAVIQVETVLGSGTSLRGNLVNLVARLASIVDPDGKLKLTGFRDLITNYGLLATSSSTFTLANHTPIGVIQAFAGSTAPGHWFLCDGTTVSRTTNAKLFAVIGTTYGVGDGTTTFNLPDLRGRIPIGVDGSANRITSASTNGANADTLGGVGGAETHILTTAQMPAHTHTGGHFASGGAGAEGTSPAAELDTSTGSTGGGAAHSNTQPWIALNYIIFNGV